MKTNKQLLKSGLTNYELMELLEEYLQEFQEEGYIYDLGLDTSYDYTIEFNDCKGRYHTIVMNLLDEQTDEYSEKFVYSTEKDGDAEKQWYGEIKSQYRNSKELASIKATLNMVKRLVSY